MKFHEDFRFEFSKKIFEESEIREYYNLNGLWIIHEYKFCQEKLHLSISCQRLILVFSLFTKYDEIIDFSFDVFRKESYLNLISSIYQIFITKGLDGKSFKKT